VSSLQADPPPPGARRGRLHRQDAWVRAP
jgi:hypothetical protein